MILLDTNFLLDLVASPSIQRRVVVGWLQAGEKLATSTIAWSEFLNGPVKREQILAARGTVEGRIISFGEVQAAMAADLFNSTGRRRSTKIDCFIAATAICAQARIATLNQKDFRPFVSAGLQLA